jgi:hypothetical protein
MVPLGHAAGRDCSRFSEVSALNGSQCFYNEEHLDRSVKKGYGDSQNVAILKRNPFLRFSYKKRS